ncbi:hypothetical protein FACS1894181_12190 [Bacteroidia bacterium]|nr:hypothetical protein FACS1894181_12190 [Bacteroidia bacterium]
MIEAFNHPGESFAENEQVLVCGKESMARLAVGLSFVIPLVLVLSVVFVTIGLLEWEESAGALAGLAVLAPWYLGVYLLRNLFKKKIVFTVKKIKQPVI